MLDVCIFCLLLSLVCRTESTINQTTYRKALANLDTKYLTSPRWPLQYPNNHDSFYKIVPSQVTNCSCYTELKWLEFDITGKMGDCKDFVSIQIGQRTGKNFTFCSSQLPHKIFSIDEEIRIHFHSDQSANGYGFRASYRLVPFVKSTGFSMCSNGLLAPQSRQGIISSQSWPRPTVGSASSCVYRSILKTDEIFQLNIIDFENGNSKENCNEYSNYIEVRGNSAKNSFHRSCALFALSSCDNITKWTWQFSEQTTIYIHLNLINASRKTRGFLAGYLIYKRGNKTVSARSKNTMSTLAIMDAAAIGAIAGVLLGLFIVLVTIMSVTLCIKKGVL
eukprot:Seg4418.1 transcript_id=Seg4418.1/GoldUCD/mRNA.D3Y31 product=Cubilin protein_id=Seg4418.1/GoldUCD/D3Y31